MEQQTSAVAEFVTARIREVGKRQNQIAREAGFPSPNVLTMIKRGQTKLPLARVGALARALETDPLLLMKMRLAEYQPETWSAVAPFFEEAFTTDEVQIVKVLRRAVGGPYLAALSPQARHSLDAFVREARTAPQMH
jgi:hypothetical protein